ncbi:MAG: RHS repeat protein [Firmicutes bacterium]|nr:RHS repeat protein [Bacillota bacterium]
MVLTRLLHRVFRSIALTMSVIIALSGLPLSAFGEESGNTAQNGTSSVVSDVQEESVIESVYGRNDTIPSVTQDVYSVVDSVYNVRETLFPAVPLDPSALGTVKSDQNGVFIKEVITWPKGEKLSEDLEENEPQLPPSTPRKPFVPRDDAASSSSTDDSNYLVFDAANVEKMSEPATVSESVYSPGTTMSASALNGTANMFPIKNKAGLFSVGFAPNAGGGLMRFDYQETGLSVKLKDAAPAVGEIAKNSILYPNIYPETDLLYTVEKTRVKESIILKRYTGIDSFSFEFDKANSNYVKGDDSTYKFYKLGSDEPLYCLEKPYAVDSRGGYCDNVILELTDEGNMNLSIDPYWLRDAVYPVTVDPTIVLTESTGAGNGIEAYYNYTGGSLGGGWSVSTNTYNLNTVLSKPLFVIPGRGLAIGESITYNSVDGRDGPLGIGWHLGSSSSVEERIDDDVVIYTEGDGSAHEFTIWGSSYYAPPGIYLTMEKTSSSVFTITDKKQNVYTYTNGKLTQAVDRHGNTTTYTYDGSGRLHQLSDPSGRDLTYTYNANGKVSAITDPDSRSFTFGYSGGRLASVTDPEDNGVELSYDGNGRLSCFRDPLDRVTQFVFTPSGKLVKVLDARSSSNHEPAAGTLSPSGITVFNAAQAVDNDITTIGWDTDTSTAGAFITADLGAGNAKAYTKAAIYASASGYIGKYNVQYSDDGSIWQTAATDLVPSSTGWNYKTWANHGAHRYWRLLLTNTPGARAGLSELEFYVDQDPTTGMLSQSGLTAFNPDKIVDNNTFETSAVFTRATSKYKSDGTEVAIGAPSYESGKFGNGVHITEATTNLLAANQSSVETNTTGFLSISSATMTRSNEQAWNGSYSLKVVTPGTVAYEGAGTTSTSVTASITYTASVWLKGTGTVNLYLREIDSSNGHIKDNSLTGITLTSTWTRYMVSGTFGATGVNARIYVRANGTQAITFYADGFQLEQKAYATPWHIGGGTRNADFLYYTLANALPNDWFASGFWKPDQASTFDRTNAAMLLTIQADNYNRYWLGYYPSYDKLRFYKEYQGTPVTMYTSDTLSFNPGDTIAWAVAQLTQAYGDLPAGMHLWYRINNGLVIHLNNTDINIPDAPFKVYPGGYASSSYPSNGVTDAVKMVDLNAEQSLGISINNAWAQSFLTASSVPEADAATLLLCNFDDTLSSSGGCGWNTDTSAAGAYLSADLGAGNAKAYTKAGIYSGGSNAGSYKVQYSDNGTAWSDAATDFVPDGAGWHYRTWGDKGAHRYWRLYLTNAPGNGANLYELQLLEREEQYATLYSQTTQDGKLVTTVTDPGEVATTYTHNSSGNLEELTDALDHSWQYTWSGNKLTKVEDAKGSKSYEYDTRGNVTKITTTIDGDAEYDIVEEMTYDDNNDLEVYTDGSGRKTSYKYDNWGNMLSAANSCKEANGKLYDQYGNLLQSSPGVSNTRNVLENGSFELYNSEENVFVYWPKSTNFNLTLSREGFYSHGNWALKLTSSDTSKSGYLYQTCTSDGSYLTLKADIKVENVQPGPGDGGAYVELTVGSVSKRIYCSGSGTVPLVITNYGATDPIVKVGMVNATGTAWFDGVQLEDGEDRYSLSGFNSVENSSFEQPLSFWTSSGAMTQSAVKHWGNDYSGMINKTTSGTYAFYQDVPVYGGEPLTLSGMVRPENVVGTGAYLQLEYYDSSGALISTPLQTSKLTGTQEDSDEEDGIDDFTQLTLLADAPANAVKCKVKGVLEGRGKVYFDCIKLVPKSTTKYTYNTAGNYMTVSQDPLGKQVGYAYNEDIGTQTSVTDPLNHTTSFSYDDLNRLTQVTDPLSHSAYYEYDGVSNLTATRDPRSASGSDNNYKYIYVPNVLNQLDTLTDPLTKNTTSTYNYSGLLSRVSLPNGKEIYYDYDRANRLSKKTLDNGGFFSYTYDEANNLTGVTDEDSHQYNYDYDGAGRVTSSTDPSGQTLNYWWDNSNNIYMVDSHAACGGTIRGTKMGYIELVL